MQAYEKVEQQSQVIDHISFGNKLHIIRYKLFTAHHVQVMMILMQQMM